MAISCHITNALGSLNCKEEEGGAEGGAEEQPHKEEEEEEEEEGDDNPSQELVILCGSIHWGLKTDGPVGKRWRWERT